MNGLSNEIVQRITISDSNIPFIITQLFETFPNAFLLDILDGGLTRIQPGAFAVAKNLQRIVIMRNQNLKALESMAFAGLTKLAGLVLDTNGIELIHEDAFVGLNAVATLQMRDNRVGNLPAKVFSFLTSLRTLQFDGNSLTSLDGSLFANNRHIQVMHFRGNKIESIGRNFLDGLTSLFNIDLRENVCTNKSINVRDSADLRILEICYN